MKEIARASWTNHTWGLSSWSAELDKNVKEDNRTQLYNRCSDLKNNLKCMAKDWDFYQHEMIKNLFMRNSVQSDTHLAYFVYFVFTAVDEWQHSNVDKAEVWRSLDSCMCPLELAEFTGEFSKNLRLATHNKFESFRAMDDAVGTAVSQLRSVAQEMRDFQETKDTVKVGTSTGMITSGIIGVVAIATVPFTGGGSMAAGAALAATIAGTTSGVVSAGTDLTQYFTEQYVTSSKCKESLDNCKLVMGLAWATTWLCSSMQILQDWSKTPEGAAIIEQVCTAVAAGGSTAYSVYSAYGAVVNLSDDGVQMLARFAPQLVGENGKWICKTLFNFSDDAFLLTKAGGSLSAFLAPIFAGLNIFFGIWELSNIGTPSAVADSFQTTADSIGPLMSKLGNVWGGR